MTARRYAPATTRNRGPILDVLRRVLPTGPTPNGSSPTVLEIASGSGEHAVHFAAALPALRWQPSDIDEANLASIAAWIDAEGTANVAPPLRVDAAAPPWPVGPIDALFNANMIHIAPWAACEGLLRGAAHHLVPGGPLILYGPYRIGGADTAPSNAAFDADLRARDPRWGVRDLEVVLELAASCGLGFEERVPMPANNQVLILRKTGQMLPR